MTPAVICTKYYETAGARFALFFEPKMGYFDRGYAPRGGASRNLTLRVTFCPFLEPQIEHFDRG